MSRDAVLYIHGKGGRPDEAEHYRALFPAHEILGLDYRGAAPQTAGPEIRAAVGALAAEGKAVTLVANSMEREEMLKRETRQVPARHHVSKDHECAVLCPLQLPG